MEGLQIGIISLGWLGEKLAKQMSQNGAKVWGTVNSQEKANRLKIDTLIEAIVWKSEVGISELVKSKLLSTDVLILNLPPSVFQHESYAGGLVQFLPFLSQNSKVIFTSSTSVYPSNLLNCKESYVFKEKEISRIEDAENALKKRLGQRLTILRLAGLIGEDRHPVNFLAKKKSNDHPKKSVNLIHRKDVISIIEKVIREDFFGEILNVCNPNHPMRIDYYSAKAEQLKLPKLNFHKDEIIQNDKIVDCDKLVKFFGFTKFTEL